MNEFGVVITKDEYDIENRYLKLYVTDTKNDLPFIFGYKKTNDKWDFVLFYEWLFDEAERKERFYMKKYDNSKKNNYVGTVAMKVLEEFLKR